MSISFIPELEVDGGRFSERKIRAQSRQAALFGA